MSTNDWLSIRESIDSRFRSAGLARPFMKSAKEASLIVDLGSGTGANFRYLSNFDHSTAQWLGIDRDRELLGIARNRLPRERIQLLEGDLAKEFGWIPIHEKIAITASAFLDITSMDWLQQFADRGSRSPILISMTAAGGPIWAPADDFDVAIELCLESHRASDHGFGPAVGANASNFLAQELTARGCDVTLATTDWCLQARDAEIIQTLIDGVCRRASSTLPEEQIERWMRLRYDQNRHGCLHVTVPHLDLLSLPGTLKP
ncbi:class I SAM-dependent methyltransferase [Allorhodopirellula heiligendammensis]|uniref:Methyltransferase domain protein n=1 Tax=Allorhodopirellula heiligendammensis TaxID=2714739 RepID=A0A5C6BV82_9BACT|nr:class I SAM-dependent methyltransferase [Allorhodopirellula heiligendammensis]TWU15351.1 Methyltransferase domain protein [Allorhodopirellula heiligendammensis]